MQGFARRHPFWAYYGVALSIPSVLFSYLMLADAWAPAMGSGAGLFALFVKARESLHQSHPLLMQNADGLPAALVLYALVPLALPFLLFPLAPTLAAVAVLWRSRGRRAVPGLLSLYRPILGSLSPGAGVRIYALLMACIALGVCVLIMISAISGTPGAAADFAAALGLFDWRLSLGGWLVALFLNQGALLEELGWRGYAWPLLVRHWASPLRAALALGIAWALWHSPRDAWMLASGQQTGGELGHFLFGFIPACIGMTVVAVYFVNITGGSVWPAIMLHGSFNYLGQAYTANASGIRSTLPPEYAAAWVCAAIAVVLLAGADLGWRRRQAVHGIAGKTDPSLAWGR